VRVYTDYLKIKGSLPGSVNPLPMFHSPQTEKPLRFDDSFTEEDRKLFGKETGFRVLPYLMQDEYGRADGEIELKTAILENDRLKAVFLMDYGGRLASLTDKQSGRDLVFRNPVFQPANLSQRNAWFSGGIEWNIGRFGHTVFTCSPLFFASLTDDEGNQFLRAWEYERLGRTFFSMDFHLPEGADQLAVHVRIVNENTKEVPMYWWTNIAVPEDERLRILSSTDDVIYIKPESNLQQDNIHEFSRAKLQNLPSMDGKDPSYPREFEYSSEYFFQTKADTKGPWEAAVYDDGLVFFERSTAALRYRKMFCWGTHRGGRNWCDYLSEPGEGDYVEIQAGLSPSQVHGLRMPAQSEWNFTQVFGAFKSDRRKFSGPWNEVSEYAGSIIDDIIAASEIERRNRKYEDYSKREPEVILHYGSGWAALEEARRKADADGRLIPAGMIFPYQSLDNEQAPWLNLLESGRLPALERRSYPDSYMTDQLWEDRLNKAAALESDSPWPLIHLGVLYYENRRNDEAVSAWTDSLKAGETSIAWRNIGVAHRDAGRPEQAANALLRAAELEGAFLSEAIALEATAALCLAGKYQEAWVFFSGLPEELKSREKLAVAAAEAASELGYDDYLKRIFSMSFAYIKEGETRLIEYWYRMKARALSKEGGSEDYRDFLQEARLKFPPPSNIDFMMA